MDLFDFYNMKVCCVFSIESTEAILMSTHNIPFLSRKMKIILNYAKSAITEFVLRNPRTSLKQPW